ncbi:MAG: D-alanine--D-alanine ligase [Gammaproteobacteria bacterium]|nr:D-alanine--D-alanine ligase [Gammaproteobacteria bacterium]
MNGVQVEPVSDPARFGKVAVLLGGSSSEREISLLTGEAVHQALLRRGVDAHRVDPASDFPAALLRGGFDRAWIALHGRGGEDGTMQGLLACLGMPFTGSGVLGSAIAMDKLRSKRLLEAAGVPTPRFRVLRGERDFAGALADLGLPLIVKPACEGSSIGMTKVQRAEDLAHAYAAAARFGGEVFAEQWVAGAEYTAAILQERVLPLIRIEARAIFYDYQAKYFSDDTRYLCPCGLSAAEEQRFADVAAAAFETVGASGWGRVDIMVGADGVPQVLEINTVPGMTSHSLVPMAAAAAGIGFDELVWRILETSFAGVTRRDSHVP